MEFEFEYFDADGYGSTYTVGRHEAEEFIRFVLTDEANITKDEYWSAVVGLIEGAVNNVINYLLEDDEFVDRFMETHYDEAKDYFRDDAEEYFNEPFLAEIEDEEYKSAVYAGLGMRGW